MFIEQFIKTGYSRYIVGLAIIPVILANMHAALFPIYFVVFLPYIAEYIIALFIRKKYPSREDKKIVIEYNKNTKWLIVIFCVCLFTGLLTPLRGIPYTYLINSLQGNTMDFIAEHQPVVLIHDFKLLSIFAIIIILISLRDIKINLRDIFMLVGMSILAIISYKQFPIFFICTMCILNKLIYMTITNIKEKRKQKQQEVMMQLDSIKLKKKKEFANKIKSIPQKLFTLKGMAYVILFVIIVALFEYRDVVVEDYIDENEYPVLAVEWMHKNLDVKNMRLFNDFNYGSYLLFKDIPVFIDGRADVYDCKFNGKGDDSFIEYMLASSLEIWYDDIMRKYDITHIITENDSKLNMLLEKTNENYKIIYRDVSFTIYEVL